MKLYIYDTEGCEEMPDDFASATGWEYVVLDQRFSKAKKVTHSTPESLLAAIEHVENQGPGNILLIDSATDVTEHYRRKYGNANPGKDIPYSSIDAKMWPVVEALKFSDCHWILTLQEKDDKLNKVTIGKKGKASAQLEYAAKIKIHCQQITKGGKKSVRVSVSDQRSLREGDVPSFEKPTVSDLEYLVEKITPEGHRRFRAQLYGRPEGGKSNTAYRLAIALAKQLGKPEGSDK